MEKKENIKESFLPSLLEWLYKCKVCDNMSEQPFIYPCGHVICLKHSQETNKLQFEEQLNQIHGKNIYFI